MEEAGEDRGIGEPGELAGSSDYLVAIVDPGDDRAPVKNPLGPDSVSGERGERLLCDGTVDRLDALVIYSRPGDE